jgi:hypothetical protein
MSRTPCSGTGEICAGGTPTAAPYRARRTGSVFS